MALSSLVARMVNLHLPLLETAALLLILLQTILVEALPVAMTFSFTQALLLISCLT